MTTLLSAVESGTDIRWFESSNESDSKQSIQIKLISRFESRVSNKLIRFIDSNLHGFETTDLNHDSHLLSELIRLIRITLMNRFAQLWLLTNHIQVLSKKLSLKDLRVDKKLQMKLILQMKWKKKNFPKRGYWNGCYAQYVCCQPGMSEWTGCYVIRLVLSSLKNFLVFFFAYCDCHWLTNKMNLKQCIYFFFKNKWLSAFT